MASAALLIGVPCPEPSVLDGREVVWPALSGVANDLDAVVAMLRDAERPLLAASIMTLLAPQDTTAENILRQVSAHADQLDPGDTLIMMLNGHGYHVRDVNHDDGDGWDEVFIGSDGVPVLDDEFSAIWEHVDHGATVIGLVDTCCADTSGFYVEHPARTLPAPALAVTLRTRDAASLLFLSASLAEQNAYETTVSGEERGVLSVALTEVWRLTEGARDSYEALFAHTQHLAAHYDDRQQAQVRFTGTELSAVAGRRPFSVGHPEA